MSSLPNSSLATLAIRLAGPTLGREGLEICVIVRHRTLIASVLLEEDVKRRG